jgi:hypothetical protein
VPSLAGVRALEGENALHSPSQLTIAPHVHVCVTADGCVLLDLKRDKYSGLGRAQTQLLADAIRDWPKPSWDGAEHPGNSVAESAQADELCGSLAAQGLLVPVGKGSCAPRVPLLDMRRDWISIGDELEVPHRICLADIVNFVAAFVWARGSLGLRPLLTTVQSVRAEKSRTSGEIVAGDILDLAARVDVFRRLRPFLFAAEGRCLLHALTLVRFLGRYGFYPEWVIGVATQPWGAHSWVQWGNFLLDSNPEKVCRYTPILMV